MHSFLPPFIITSEWQLLFVLHLQRCGLHIRVGAPRCHFLVALMNLQLHHHLELSTMMPGTLPGPAETATCQALTHTLQSVLIIMLTKGLVKCLCTFVSDNDFHFRIYLQSSHNFPSATSWPQFIVSY